MNKLDEVLADLAAEGDQLESLVSTLTDDQWRAQTPAEGWDVATQIAHLTWTDEVAVIAATDKEAWDAGILEALVDPVHYVDNAALEAGKADPADLLARWRAARPLLVKTLREYPEGEKLPWFGPPMSPTSMATARFMETWAHALDVYETFDAVLAPTDRVRHVVFLGTITRKYAFVMNGLPVPEEDVHVSLTLPSGALFEHGSPDATNTLRGSAYDFALRATQRRHRHDLDLVATGPIADQWIDIAQAFAGPPGSGRPSS